MKDKEKDKDAPTRRKPGRVPTACAECRRLKLKCDKKVPCTKCVSRGCESICPDGALAAGKNNRLILSGTEELHDRISRLCGRIRQLEEALALVQSKVTDEPHPLLRSDLLQIKAPQNLTNPHPNANANGNSAAPGVGAPGTGTERMAASASTSTSTSIPPPTSGFVGQCSNKNITSAKDENFIDAFGTLSIGANGETSFLGKTARSEYLIRALVKPSPHPPNSSYDCPRLPKKIIDSRCPNEGSSPVSSAGSSLGGTGGEFGGLNGHGRGNGYGNEYEIGNGRGYRDDEEDIYSLGEEIWSHLPEMSKALKLCDVYLDAGRYMYTAIPRSELLDDILAPVYRSDSFCSLPHKHTLALLFIIFALGTLFDPKKEPYSIEAKEYFYLARAAKNYAASMGLMASGSDSGSGAKGFGPGSRPGPNGRVCPDGPYGDGEGEEDGYDHDYDVDEDEDESGAEGDEYGYSRSRSGYRRGHGPLPNKGGGYEGSGGSESAWGMSVIGLWTTVHMSQYLEFSDWEALGSTTGWWFVAFSARLATSLGLHLNSARWKVPEEMQKKRALVFWQIFNVDTWLSFHYGRPPSLSRSYIDCPLPEDTEEHVGTDGKKQIGFHTWTFQYTFFMHGIIETAFGPTSPPYSVIIDFDRQIRDFPVPQHLRPRCKLESVEQLMAMGGKENVKNVQALTMQRMMTMSYKESTLLNLHRAYFAQALHDSPDDLASHKYLPSVMATYRSAWRLIEGLKVMWGTIPRLLERYNLAWSQALSAAIVMCILITRAPHSKMTKGSLAELDAAVELFEDASSTCRSAANILDTVRTLRQKAYEAVDHTQHLSCPRLSADELDRLGGRTHLISTPSTTSTKSSWRRSKAGSHTTSSNSTSPAAMSSNHASPASHAGSSPAAGPSQTSQHILSSSGAAASTTAASTQGVMSSLPASTPFLETSNLVSEPQAQNSSLTFQDLFPTENMHPCIAHDMQLMDIINDPTISVGSGPWPSFYDLPTGMPGSATVPMPLPQYTPSTSSSVSQQRNGVGTIYTEPTGIFTHHSGESSPNEPMADIQFPDSQPTHTRRYSGATDMSFDSRQSMDWSMGMNMGSANVNVPPDGWPPSVPFVDVPLPFYDNPPSRSPMGFPTGSYSSVNPITGAPILDATWQSFVEQLGF